MFLFKTLLVSLSMRRSKRLDTLFRIMQRNRNAVSESDMLGPIAHLSYIDNLVSFERAMFEDYSFKHRIKIFLLFMSISPH